MTGPLARFSSIIAFVLAWSFSLSAQQYPDAKVDQLLKAGIDNLINHQYRDAEKKFLRLKNEFPDLPFGNIYLAALRIVRSEDLGEQFDEAYISGRFAEAEDQCSKLLDNNGNNIWNLYFNALLKGQKAYFNAIKHNYIQAFSTGLSSVSNFEKCLKLDPSFYESYTAIGTYKYWRSEKTSFLNWLPFVSNEKETGIKYLQLSVAKSSYNRYLAKNSLIWIYINEKRSGEAAAMAEQMLKEYPENRTFKWALARAFMDMDKRKAFEVYSDLLNSYLSEENQNHYQEIVLKHKMAMISRDLGDTRRALNLCSEILGTNGLQPWVSDKLDSRLKRVSSLRDELRGL